MHFGLVLQNLELVSLLVLSQWSEFENLRRVDQTVFFPHEYDLTVDHHLKISHFAFITLIPVSTRCTRTDQGDNTSPTWLDAWRTFDAPEALTLER